MADRYVNGSMAGNRVAASVAAPTVSVLLVEPDAGLGDDFQRHLTDALPGLVATRCETLASARAYLAGTAFDAVCTADELPDGSGLTLLDLRDGLHLEAPFFVQTRRNGTATTEARHAGADACFDLSPGGASLAEAAVEIVRRLGHTPAVIEERTADEAAPLTPDDDVRLLIEALRTETGMVAHAINNPLTVIAGNAQFLLEMARMTDLDPMLARPIEDIEVATHQLAEALERLATLRQRIAAALGAADRL